MKVFNEFLLDADSSTEQTVYLPADSEVVNIIKTGEGIKLLVLAKYAGYDSQPPEIHKFKICASDEIFYLNIVKYIGSFESSLGIRHVIETD